MMSHAQSVQSRPSARLHLMTSRIAPTACLVKEPHAPFVLIDPHFEQARGRHIVLLVAEVMRLAHARDQVLVVRSELGQHVEWIDIIGVIVWYALEPGDIADRMQRDTTNFPYALGDVV